MTDIRLRLEITNVTPEQRRVWSDAAKREKRTLSSWARTELDKAAARSEARPATG